MNVIEKLDEKEKAAFIEGWSWDRVFETWKGRVEEFGIDINRLFKTAACLTAQPPTRWWRTGTELNCVLRFWRPRPYRWTTRAWESFTSIGGSGPRDRTANQRLQRPLLCQLS